MGEMNPLVNFFSGIANDPRIGITHIALYSALYQLWVKQHCINPIRIYSYTVMPAAKIFGLSTYHKAIRELNEYGYIRYEATFNRKGSKVYLVD